MAYFSLTQSIQFYRSGANGVSTPLLIAAVAAVGGFFYWRWKQTQDTSKSFRSPFKFPAAKSPSSQQQQESSLPRNKAGNNKKNKARKKQEKERRAQKKEAAATGKKAGSSSSNNNNKQKGDSGAPQSAAVLNYSYWDSGRNDSSIKIKPKDNKVKPEDVMPQS